MSIGIWGDSIAWGAYDLELGGWANRLRLLIDNKQTGQELYNLGVSGNKVKDVIDRFDAEYQARKPEVIILAVGINDSPHRSIPEGTPLELFKEQYSQLVLKALNRTTKLMIVGPTNVDDSHESNRGWKNTTIKIYNDSIKEIANRNGVTFVDLEGLITKEDLVLDGLHPISSGHSKIYEAVKRELETHKLI